MIGLIPDSNTDKRNMLQGWNSLKVRYFQAQATSYWGDGTNSIPTPLTITNLDPENEENHKIWFYKRVRSEMISKDIEAHLTTSSFKKLLLNKKDFTWTKDDGTICYDGPTMLLICLQLVNPSTNIRVEKYISKLEQATMSKYGNKVPDMLDDMKMYHNSIIDHSVSVVSDKVVDLSKQFARQIFISLATGSNGVFNNWLQRKKDKFDETGITDPDTLIRSAKMKYINMTDKWDRQEPRDAKRFSTHNLPWKNGNSETIRYKRRGEDIIWCNRRGR